MLTSAPMTAPGATRAVGSIASMRLFLDQHRAELGLGDQLARDRDLVVRQAAIDPATCTLDMADLRAKITERTKLVAVGYASNAVGTINDVATIVGWAHEVGALAWIDAVQYAPHGPIDVRAPMIVRPLMQT